MRLHGSLCHDNLREREYLVECETRPNTPVLVIHEDGILDFLSILTAHQKNLGDCNVFTKCLPFCSWGYL